MKLSEGTKLQEIFFSKTGGLAIKPKSMERSGLVEPVFVNKRSSGIRFENYIKTYSFANAHEGNITCLASLKRGVYMTASTDGVLKFWNPLENVPIATLDESESRSSIDFLIPVAGKNEINIFYVMGSILKCFSVKNLKTATMVRGDRFITAIC